MLSFFLAMPGPALAAGIIVNSTDDSVTAGDRKCTLREAIINSNSNRDTTGGDCVSGSGADTITFRVSGTITLSSRLPDIASSDGLTIDGGSVITISGNNSVQVFFVKSGASLILQNLVVANGSAAAAGGIDNFGTLTVTNSTLSGNRASSSGGLGGSGILNSGTLTITNSTFSGNVGEGGGGIRNLGTRSTLTVTNSTFSENRAGNGGGISNEGTLTVTNSTFSENRAGFGRGGGIDNSGTITITNSTFSGNFAAAGGGILNSGTLTITNSTFSGNRGEGGGGIFNFGTLTVINSTFSGNSTTVSFGSGGGIFNRSGTTTLRNTIVANTPLGGNCFLVSGTITDGGFNIDDGTTCGFSAANESQPSTNPLLDPQGLQDNGGPTKTIKLQSTSPAIDAGNDAFCPRADQLGQQRVCACDIGAVEFQPTQTLTANNATELINAIEQANMDVSYDVINLPAGTPYTLTGMPMTFDANGPNGLPSITSKTCIKGVSAGNTTIQRDANAPKFRIFHVNTAGNLTLDELTVKGGNSADPNFGGGGIFNGGRLVLINSTVRDSMATGSNDEGGDGRGGGGITNSGIATLANSIIGDDNKSTSSSGGIENFGTDAKLILTNSTVRNNLAGFDGGGIGNSSGATITNSTISGNSALRFGGGINNFGTGVLTLTNSTVSNNDGLDGGGLNNSASATITNSTISGNLADRLGSGIANLGGANINNVTITMNTTPNGASGFFNNESAPVNISNTIIIAQNKGGDCEGTFNSRGFNLIGSDQNCNGFVNGVKGDKVGTSSSPINPMFDPAGLKDNGGPTLTIALQPGSPAVDAGNLFTPPVGGDACEPTDQRGFRRPIDGDGKNGARCDIGAFEFGMGIVNNSFSKPTKSTPTTSPGDVSGCPSGFFGKFSFMATFTSTGDKSLSDLMVEVEELTNGNLLQNADGGAGGVGARLTVPKPKMGGFSDGVLSRNESVDVPFVICLRNRDKFSFFVDVFGMVQ